MKYCGIVGYVQYEETAPGVHEEVITERKYYGDIVKKSSRWTDGPSINSNIAIRNTISIIADPYAYMNFAYMRYIEYNGMKFEISSITVDRPRMTIELGGIYNGQS